MKRLNATPARLPPAKVLARCIALALVVGSGVLSPEYANAQGALRGVALPDESSLASVQAAGLSPERLQALIEQAQSMARTPPPVPAASIGVTNCLDSGANSFRAAMTAAADGDTIDLTNTGCSVITLTTGQTFTSANNLTLQGPGLLNLSIDGGNKFRVIEHLASGTLTVNDLTISHGKHNAASGFFDFAEGGCIDSAGTVALYHSRVRYCDMATSVATGGVRGGAIYATVGVNMHYSIVSNSSAHTAVGTYAYGGGVYSRGFLIVADSSITGNTAQTTGTFGQGGGVQVGSVTTGGNHHTGGGTLVVNSTIDGNTATGVHSYGGGLYTTGSVTIDSSTISGNQAQHAGGLDLVAGTDAGGVPWTILSSTISGNNTTGLGAGIIVGSNPTQIKNSTIAFNTDHTTGTNKYGAGLRINSPVAVELESTIIANNTTDEGNGPLLDDAGGVVGGSFTGANNLIFFTSSLTPPPGTKTFTDPRLSPLSSNGGPTKTHALMSPSPAINTGNNVAGAAFDQRGPGHPRVIGAGPDIGAFESDVIFANGFD